MPPRHGKSELANKHFAAWHQGVYPSRDLIITSATDELVVDFSKKALDLLIEHGEEVFNQKVREDIRAQHRWQMEAGGAIRAAGVGGSIMGRGADGLLVDDYVKDHESAISEVDRERVHSWYLSTASTRLSPNAWVIVIATRWHRKDLIGRLLDAQLDGGDRWGRLRFPAIAEENDSLGRKPGEALWPERFSLEWLLKKQAGYVANGKEWMWEALYQQNPPDSLDAEFSPEYFPDSMWFTEWPPLEGFVHKVQTCDPSLGASDKSDYQAHVYMALDKYGVMWVEADLRRRDRTQIAEDMMEVAKWFKPEAIGIETNMWQIMLADVLYDRSKLEGFGLPIWPINNQAKKVERIRATLTPYLARTEFRFRATPGTRLLVEQLKGFPSTKFDDGPDALEMAVRLMRNLWEASLPARPPVNEAQPIEGIIASRGVLG